MLQQLGLPKFRALLVARLLSISNPTLYDMEQRDIGDFAELGLWLLLGHPTEQARAMVDTSPFKAGVDKIFLALVENLPSALAAVDQHGVVERLAHLHLLPTSAQCVEHICCASGAGCAYLREGRLGANPLKTTRSCGWQWRPPLRDVPPPASEWPTHCSERLAM